MASKPAGLVYSARGTRSGHPMVAYSIAIAEEQYVPGFEGSQTILTKEPVADGFDYDTLVNDGGAAGDGVGPGLVSEWLIFDGAHANQDVMLSAYGWDPFDLAYRPGVDLPTLSSLILDVLAAPLTDQGVDAMPLPGHPGLVYERFWEPGSNDARVHLGTATPGVEYARYDAGAFVPLLASDRHVEFDITPASNDPYLSFLLSSGYNVLNDSSSDKVIANSTISGAVYLYDYGPLIADPAEANHGQDAWTNSITATAPNPAIEPPADYSWPGVFGLVTVPPTWTLVPGSDTRALTVDDLGWFGLLDENPCTIVDDIVYMVSGFLYDAFDVIDIGAWVATQPGLTLVGDKSQQEFDYVNGDVWYITNDNGSTAWSATGPGHFDAATNWPNASSGDNSALLSYRNRGYSWRLQNEPNEYAWPFLERFNIATGQWLPRLPMPTVAGITYAAEGGFVAVHDGKIYFGGGDGHFEDGGSFFMFDPATEEFTVLPNMPMTPDYSPWGMVGDTFYTILTTTLWSYNFTTATWSSANLSGPMVKRDWVQGQEYDGKLVFAVDQIWVVDVEALTVTATPFFPSWNGLPVWWISDGILHASGWDYLSNNGEAKQAAFDMRDLVNGEYTEEEHPGVVGRFTGYAVKDGVPYVVGGISDGRANLPPSGILTGLYSFGSATPSGGGGSEGASGVSAIGGTLSVIGGALSAVGG